jgi:ribosome-associated heat shock protein Hsp15
MASMDFHTTPQPETVRLDRWLMAARFYKTRSQAAEACNGGKIKVNGLSSKPHKPIRPGDRLTVHHHDRYRNIEVVALAQRGLPPKVARELYKEEIRQTLSGEAEELLRMMKQADKKIRFRFKGRPTKKERRTIDKWKGHRI